MTWRSGDRVHAIAIDGACNFLRQLVNVTSISVSTD
jgi:hypothetical protein